MMKIVEIITQLSSGGAERFTVDLCNELSKENDVTLIVVRSLDKYGFYYPEVSPRVKVISMNKISKWDFSSVLNIRKQIKNLNPDVVHLHLGSIIYGFLAILAAKSPKYFYTVHSDAKRDAKGLIGAIIRKLCFKLNLVRPITISIGSLKSFVDYYRMDAPMIFNGRDIPNSLQVSQIVKNEFSIYRKDNNTKVLICLARIMPVKRQPMLAKIVYRLSKEGYNLSLILIGNARDNDMVDEIKSYNCQDIYILGEKNNPLEYLKMADSYCLCSSYEGMPISLIEAMGVGAIPVCTPVGGVVDVIENKENGFLARDISEEAYYNSLKEFLSLTEDQVIEIKQNVIKSYAPFSMKQCANSYYKLFSK